ncbi:hypothetical protein DY000_02053636 [Brassica cretica]|uniref:Uncharacterized protein n=1 Tax=Brassica cretica TaxID=69181 RepID=A0ABQ7ALC2_BRACR|nr:hypothetical protein DY000_02053636 [Brassica cretica]
MEGEGVFLGQVYDSTFEGFDVGGMHDNFMKFSYDLVETDELDRPQDSARPFAELDQSSSANGRAGSTAGFSSAVRRVGPVQFDRRLSVLDRSKGALTRFFALISDLEFVWAAGVHSYHLATSVFVTPRRVRGRSFIWRAATRPHAQEEYLRVNLTRHRLCRTFAGATAAGHHPFAAGKPPPHHRRASAAAGDFPVNHHRCWPPPATGLRRLAGRLAGNSVTRPSRLSESSR